MISLNYWLKAFTIGQCWWWWCYWTLALYGSGLCCQQFEKHNASIFRIKAIFKIPPLTNTISIMWDIHVPSRIAVNKQYLIRHAFNFQQEFQVCKSVHHHTIQINQPTRCNNFSNLLLDVYIQLNMFRCYCSTTATAVVELLMMGVRTPETCWAVYKRQVINLRNCYI
jgi:hypothetical protein